MRPGGGSVKGADFERFIANRFSAWASEGRSNDIFWRTAGSGSRGTTQGAARQLGDIGALTALGEKLTGRVLIECKCYLRLDWTRWLLEGKGELADFWWKTCEVGDKYHRFPFLIIKENLRPTMVAMGQQVLTPRLLVAAKRDVQPRYIYLNTLEDLLAFSYKDFTAHLAKMPYEASPYHRPASKRAAIPRLPTSLPRVALIRR